MSISNINCKLQLPQNNNQAASQIDTPSVVDHALLPDAKVQP